MDPIAYITTHVTGENVFAAVLGFIFAVVTQKRGWWGDRSMLEQMGKLTARAETAEGEVKELRLQLERAFFRIAELEKEVKAYHEELLNALRQGGTA